jgi:hypothetical protein
MIERAPQSGLIQGKHFRDDSWLYCVTCTHDNKYDWRMPTPDERHHDMSLACRFTDKDLKLVNVIRICPVRDTDD